jgi:hypothetical protein
MVGKLSPNRQDDQSDAVAFDDPVGASPDNE